MSETKDHTIADHGAAVDEGRDAALAAAAPAPQPPIPADGGATPPTPSDMGTIPTLAPSDTSTVLTPTVSDINPAPAAEVRGPDDNDQPDQPQASPLALNAAAGTSDSGEKRTANHEIEADAGSGRVKLCRHIKEDGVFCQIAALGGRQYCYRHLRLRGQQMRMARAIAQRQTFHLELPPLEDLNAVQTALIHVTAALAAGLLERHRAGQLLYAVQQAASNLRYLERAQQQATMGAPPFSPASGERVGEGPQRVVKEYPQFEAEFGLPPGLDLTLPPQVAFPPPETATANPPAAAPTSIHSPGRWTKEAIELEELDNQRRYLSEESYNKQSRKVNDKIHHQVVVKLRKEREAEWEAEAARRNAEEVEKLRRWNSMDAGEQRAFMEGVWTGRKEEAAEQEQRRQEAARAKKPAATASHEEAGVGMGELAEKEAAK